MDKKENLCFEMSTQSSDLKLTEMLWHDQKKVFWSRHPEIFMSTAEQFCTEKWLKIPPYHCLTLIISYKKQMMAILLLKKVRQTIFKEKKHTFYRLHCSCLMYSLKNNYLFYKFTHTTFVYNRDLNDDQTRFYH